MSNTPVFGTLNNCTSKDDNTEVETASNILAAIAAAGTYLYFSQAEETARAATLVAVTVGALTYYASSIAMWLNSHFRESNQPTREREHTSQTKITDFFAIKTQHPQRDAKDENTFALDNKENSPKMQKR